MQSLPRRIRARVSAHRPNRNGRVALGRDVLGPLSSEFERRLVASRAPAAVLVGCIERPTGVRVLMVQRAENLRSHGGQVAFPGGRPEAGDDGPWGTALREAEEEIGLETSQVEWVGQLDRYTTVTGYEIDPVVGFLSPEFRPRPDGGEIVAAFEVPLDFLLDPAQRQVQERELWGTRVRSYEYRYERFRIWGATAAMIQNFLSIINFKQ